MSLDSKELENSHYKAKPKNIINTKLVNTGEVDGGGRHLRSVYRQSGIGKSTRWSKIAELFAELEFDGAVLGQCCFKNKR